MALTYSNTTTKVNGPTLFGTLWAGTAFSLLFLIFRLWVRSSVFRKLFADDYFVIAAWTITLSNNILLQTQESNLYNLYAVDAGTMPATPEWLTNTAIFERCIVAFDFLYYSSLWAVKISFLLFFKRLGRDVRGQKIWWWIVLVITIGCWAVSVGDIPFPCALNAIEWILETCNQQNSINFQERTFHANCALDVLTDCLIVSIPILILWPVQISLRRKLVLYGIFILTIFVMIISIIRVALVTTKNTNADITWLFLWSGVEMSVSIIVSCLASFRQLFNHQPYILTDRTHVSFRDLLPSFGSIVNFSFFRSSRQGSSRGGSSLPHTKQRSVSSSHGDGEPIVPLDNIYVCHNTVPGRK